MSIENAIKVCKTPFYYYDVDLLRETLKEVKGLADSYGYHVHYAIKANANPRILSEIREVGFGADCVSGNEVLAAYNSGIKPGQIVYAGVGKSDDEIETAIDHDIFCFNCESLPEIEIINEIAERKGQIASIALRINPNVSANTHAYITTGLEENKFGINMWELEKVIDILSVCKAVKLIGLHFHIGSQILDLNDYKGLCLRVNEIQQWFYARRIIVDHINVGGGLGIDYVNPEENPIPDFAAYFKVFNDLLELRPKQSLHFELGRSLVGQCGNLISKVLYVKEGVKKKFAVIDAGMTDLLRPALYQAKHKIERIGNCEPEEEYDVVGPICESSDVFGKSLTLPKISRGDFLVIKSTGAYGEAMVSNYNLRNNPNVIFSDDID
jgi:diaminopimelate decarboxylase